MDIADKILENKKYREQIDRLSNETLVLIAKDHVKALEAAQKGIKQEEQEKINDVDYLEAVGDEMQKLARKILELNQK